MGDIGVGEGTAGQITESREGEVTVERGIWKLGCWNW